MSSPYTPYQEVVGPVEVGPVAHGGHCVARHEGRVIFVRHTLPGETVRVALTDTTQKSFWRGDAVEILTPSPDRTAAPCDVARPGGCGGCDFQHVEPAAQRRLKAAVVTEQLHRLAGLDRDVVVEEVGVEQAGPGQEWRRRMRYVVEADGAPRLRQHRSAATVVVPDHGCLIAVPELAHPPAGEPGDLIGVAGDDTTLWLDGADAAGGATDPEAAVRYTAIGRRWRVGGDGFWQTHPAAADLLAATVVSMLAPEPGERALDLYAGVGLFSAALAERGARVWSVEGNVAAVKDAQHNLHDLDGSVSFLTGRVDRVLGRSSRAGPPAEVDLVVLDPPRTGAGKEVLRLIGQRRPRAVGYVACDPAALARDLATAASLGYRLADLRAFDLFPMTHHVECVALLVPTGS